MARSNHLLFLVCCSEFVIRLSQQQLHHYEALSVSNVTANTTASSSLPLAKPLAAEHVVAANAEKLLDIRGRIEVPDGREVNWPITVPNTEENNFEVADVRVTVRGVFHEDARDLQVQLSHQVRPHATL